MATKHVFIYARISEDKAGRAEGVQAQEKWGRAYAAQHWPDLPVQVFADNDISAAKEDAVRPGFNQLREGILAGQCAHLWTVEQSRLTRIESVWFGLVADLIKAGVDELHTKRDGVRRLDDVVGGIMAVLDAAEVRKLKKRINDKMGELAAQGRPIGGNATAFGYRARVLTDDEQKQLDDWQQAMLAEYRVRIGNAHRGRPGRPSVDMHDWYEANPRPVVGRAVHDEHGRRAIEVIPEQAELLRQAADWFLSGWTLTHIAAEFRRRGVKGGKGGRLVSATVKAMLTNPTVAGFRVHQGEIVGKGTWEPILDESTWRAIKAELKRRTTYTRRAARRHLLTGLLMCGTCGQRMSGGNVAVPNGHQQWSYYRCNGSPGGDQTGCGRNHIQLDDTDEFVVGALLDHLAGAGADAVPDDAAERRQLLVEALQDVDGRKLELSERWTARKLTTQQFDVMNDALTAEQQQLERELSALPRPAAKVDAAELRADWPAMPFDEQRQVLSDWIQKVVIRAYPKKPTQYDVAYRAGVSQAAVWHVLRGHSSNGRTEWGAEADETVRRVKAAAAELGYVNDGKRRPFDPQRLEVVWR
jgi:DNA invertase Pin-like site-specific DNA recombinase